MFTFVIPAYNEERTVAAIIEQARTAARPGDRVLVVDSASTDRTADAAARAGAEVLHGPRGKGAAMNTALAAVRTQWVCFLDADLVSSTQNVPAALRKAADTSSADHVVGDYEYDYPGTILSSTFTIYEPLAAALFPEVGHLGANSLTGYRAIRTSRIQHPLPPDFAVETYLNISLALAGGTAEVCHLGTITSRFRHNGGSMARQIGRAVLDMAEQYGRLEPHDRPAWDRWLEEGIAAITPQTADSGRSATLARLFTAVRRPMPTANHAELA
ncbi:glycosyltransferase family 2 protein [Actinacidiphila acididurans]|uniref:4,4'-diaponeurosporenoate glycosyltransferase n=1 Tax=Actinacidiphila acididurans TaxID=2784346 RepID=A0ABS2TWD8_9ACTN|nr:glycosyltransferase [Actinacidiphila acididurans]MBM9506816.1 glycosyltransferase [Actinacidiphila acididurans]